MKVSESKVSAKQEKLIVALLMSATVQSAAQTAGVSEPTVYRWLRDDAAFDAAYRAARRQAVQQAVARLQQLSGYAVTTLASIATDKNAPTSSRVTAASKLLDLAVRAVELEEIEARLSALEQVIKERV